jgi:dedicator of cytokinesis protein 1
MTLYDGKEGVFISENYLVKWGKEGLMRDLDQLNNLRVVFSDLGSKDLSREKVYLVCQTIRIGGMEMKEELRNVRKSSHQNVKRVSDGLRRPFGVAAMDITDYISGRIESDEEKQHFIPFAQCGERDSLDAVVRKILSAREISHKGQGLFISLKLLHGDIKQIREEYAHIVSPFTAVARKMGFPEVILPGDIRNDLYLTLVQGEFSKGSKKSERNVEVTVKVCNEKAQTLPNCLSFGAGSEPMNEYKSVVYYHEERPKWMETLKISIPIEDFYGGHLKFTFRHRSSNDNKDKTEKPFAMSFVKLMNENGTTMKDQIHELLVYKVDHKRYDESDVAYLKFPSTREELEHTLSNSNYQINQIGAKQLSAMFQTNGIIVSPKDSFIISTVVCSTKLTQNIDLLGLLKWRSNPENLKSNLLALMKLDGEEVVKFLQDTLDALFDILMQNTDSDLYDNLVFEALIFIIHLISDRKYQHFRPVLDVYIEQNFSATLVYNKLIVVLKTYIDKVNLAPENQEVLLRAMKSLEYIFKFIVRSRVLFAALNGGKGKAQFEESLKELLQSFTSMMSSTSELTLLVQGACLKYFPFALTDILCVFNEKELSYILTDLINNVPVDRLTKQKMMCVNDIIHCELFIKYADCRSILLPVINDHLRLLLEKKEEFELCIKIISDMLVVLNGRDVGNTTSDISDIMLSLTRTVIQTFIDMDRENPLVGNLVAIIIGILRQMTPFHYNQYINHFATRIDLLDFLMEILIVFRDLVRIVFPKDWNEMILLQNRSESTYKFDLNKL